MGPVPRGPVPHPARGHPRTSNGAAAAGARRCPTMRKRAYGAAALFAFLVVQLWPAARYTQGHGLHWQLHLVAHAITGGRDPHRVGVRRRARLADGAAHEQRSRVDFSSPATVLQRQGWPTYSEPSTPWPNGHHRIVQQPATHGAPEPQPLDQPPASTGDEATSNTSTIPRHAHATLGCLPRLSTCPKQPDHQPVALRNQLNPDERQRTNRRHHHERAVAAHHQHDQHETAWRAP